MYFFVLRSNCSVNAESCLTPKGRVATFVLDGNWGYWRLQLQPTSCPPGKIMWWKDVSPRCILPLILTHRARDKIAAISQTTFSIAFSFLNENIWISNKMSLKYVPGVLIDNMSALVQIMACCRPGDKPLSEPMRTHFTEAYMKHYGEMS